MLTCKELTEVVTEYLEGRMSFSRRVRLHLHLGMCQHCRAYLRQMKLTVETLGKLPDEPVPASVRDELLVRFRALRPVAPSGVLPRRGMLALLEHWLGRSRGWMLVGLTLFTATGLGVFFDGQTGPVLGMWEGCLFAELGAAAIPLVLVGIAAFRAAQPLSAGSLAAVGAGGAFVGYLALSFVCPYPNVTPHVLVVHVGGVLLGALLGTGSSRLPVFRGAST